MVAKENLSVTAGLTAAAALLIDYTLTVAVLVAVGIYRQWTGSTIAAGPVEPAASAR